MDGKKEKIEMTDEEKDLVLVIIFLIKNNHLTNPK